MRPIENGSAVKEAGEEAPSPAEVARGTAAKAFKRVKAEEWMHQKAARDNSYQATFGSSGWGARAQEVLGQVMHQHCHDPYISQTLETLRALQSWRARYMQASGWRNNKNVSSFSNPSFCCTKQI